MGGREEGKEGRGPAHTDEGPAPRARRRTCSGSERLREVPGLGGGGASADAYLHMRRLVIYNFSSASSKLLMS